MATVDVVQKLDVKNPRLRELADELDIDLTHHVTKIGVVQSLPHHFCTEGDRAEAERIVKERRLTDPEFKPPTAFKKLTKSKSKRDQLSYKEVQRAFEAAVDQNADLSLVDAYLQMGASVDLSLRRSTSLWRNKLGTPRESVSCKVLQRVASNGTDEMCRLLAAHTKDSHILDQALQIAIDKNDLGKIKALLSFNAHYKADKQDNLVQLVRNGSTEALSLLLSAFRGPSEQTKALALIEAAKISSLPKVKALLAAEADASYDDAAAMRTAVSQANIPIALVISSAQKPPNATQLDAVAELAIQHEHSSEKLQLLEICLVGKANGPRTAKILQESAAANELTIVKLLLEYKISANTEDGFALRSAIENEHMATFKALLRAPLAQSTLNTGLDTACTNAGSETLFFTEALLAKGASPDYRNGKVMLTAVRLERLDLLKVLVHASDNERASDRVLQAIVKIRSGTARAEALSIILTTQLSQECKNVSLIDLVEDKDIEGVKKLLHAGTSPDYHDGEAMLSTIRLQRLDLLTPLVHASRSWLALDKVLQAIVEPRSKSIRAEALSIVLAAESGPSHGCKDISLVTLTEEGDIEGVKKLLRAGAKPEAHDARAYTLAATLLSIPTLEVLSTSLEHESASNTKAIKAVLSTDYWRNPNRLGLEVLKWLLNRKAQRSHLKPAMIEAAADCDLRAVSFLSEFITEGDIYSEAFASMLSGPKKKAWFWPRNFKVVRLLLSKGAKGKATSDALVIVLKAPLDREQQELLCNTLLDHGTNIDQDSGLAMSLAAIEAGNVKILTRICRIRGYSPSQLSLAKAFSHAITCQHDAETTMAMLDLLVDCKGVRADINQAVSGLHPPIFLALQYHPKEPSVIRRLCELGCNVNKIIKAEVLEDQKLRKQDRVRERHEEARLPMEDITPLIWACSLKDTTAASDDIVALLLEYGADANFSTDVEFTTPLTLAVRYKRSKIVDMLLKQKNLSVSAKDKYSHSALFYASRNGDATSVKAILATKPKLDDGSLHEAARELHMQVLDLLLDAGHNVNYPSPIHAHLTPMAELAKNCDGGVHSSRIEHCIEELARRGAHLSKVSKGKNILYMAMDNSKPIPVVSALIARVLHPLLNDPSLYYEKNNLFYSPTMYLKKELFRGSEKTRISLLDMLQELDVRDVYFAAESLGYQPQGYCGLPQHLYRQQMDRQRRQEELDWEETKARTAREARDRDAQAAIAIKERDAQAAQAIRDREAQAARVNKDIDAQVARDIQARDAQVTRAIMDTNAEAARAIKERDARAAIAIKDTAYQAELSFERSRNRLLEERDQNALMYMARQNAVKVMTARMIAEAEMGRIEGGATSAAGIENRLIEDVSSVR